MIFSASFPSDRFSLRTTRPQLTRGLRTSRHLVAGLLAAVALHGQGPLTPPPGAPAPTMKSLDQIEARTIVNAANTPGDATHTFLITAPGSYYLTGNLTGAAGKHGIGILANNVTLDLNGFALIAGAAGGVATRGVTTTTAINNFCIRNGGVSGWTGGGVRAEAAVTLADNLRLAGNTGGIGLAVGNGSLVKDCVASANATGFYCGDRAQISNCIATENTAFGFDCTSYVNLLDCTASRNFGDAGIRTKTACSIQRCNSSRNLPIGTGILAEEGSTIAFCIANSNGSHGIGAFECSIVNSSAHSNGGVGIAAVEGSVAGCSASYNTGDGIIADYGVVTHCIAKNNGSHGIRIPLGVVAFCRAEGNNKRAIGGVELYAEGSTRTGNKPSP